jgi:hypothetical protein
VFKSALVFCFLAGFALCQTHNLEDPLGHSWVKHCPETNSMSCYVVTYESNREGVFDRYGNWYAIDDLIALAQSKAIPGPKHDCYWRRDPAPLTTYLLVRDHQVVSQVYQYMQSSEEFWVISDPVSGKELSLWDDLGTAKYAAELSMQASGCAEFPLLLHSDPSTAPQVAEPKP